MREPTADCRRLDAELDRRFGSARYPLSQAARRHLEQCERCRKVNSFIEEQSSPPDCAPEIYARIQSKLLVSLKPVGARPPLWAIAGCFAAIFLLVAAFAAGAMGLAGFHKMAPLQIGFTAAVLAAGAILLSISLADLITPGSLRRVWPLSAVAIVAAAFTAAVLALFPWPTPEAFFARGWPCLALGLGLAVPAAFLLWLVARRGACLRIGSEGAALGALAGLAG